MTEPDRRNERLAAWVHAAGLSRARLADEVRKTGVTMGHRDLAPDGSRITRWLGGEIPRPPMPEVLAATFSRLCRTDTPLSAADLGLTAESSRSPQGGGEAVVCELLDTTGSDLMTEPDAPDEPLETLSGEALLERVQGWLHLGSGPLPEPVRTPHVDQRDVARVREATDVFRTWDNAHGGLSRDAVVAQLRATTKLLHNARPSDAVGRDLFSAVADLASVAAWMTYDTGRHAQAQRYFLLGLDAAREAGDSAIAAHLLNCMARQASHLGRIEDALELVELAQYGTRRLPPGRTRAVLCALEARCRATLGDIGGFTRAVGASHDALEHATPDDPTFVQWFDHAEHQVTIGVCHLIASQRRPEHAAIAVRAIHEGTALRPRGRVRSRAFDQIALARAYTANGELDGADTATTAALHLMGDLGSTRVPGRLAELDVELAAVGPAAAPTRERIATALATA